MNEHLFDVTTCPSADAALTNYVYVNPSVLGTKSIPDHQHMKIGKRIYNYHTRDDIETGKIGLSLIQRKDIGVALGDRVDVSYVVSFTRDELSYVSFKILRFIKKGSESPTKIITVSHKEIVEEIYASFIHQMFQMDQEIIIKCNNNLFCLVVTDLGRKNKNKLAEDLNTDEFVETTKIFLEPSYHVNISE